jgi:hypothetical protein
MDHRRELSGHGIGFYEINLSLSHKNRNHELSNRRKHPGSLLENNARLPKPGLRGGGQDSKSLSADRQARSKNTAQTEHVRMRFISDRLYWSRYDFGVFLVNEKIRSVSLRNSCLSLCSFTTFMAMG